MLAEDAAGLVELERAVSEYKAAHEAMTAAYSSLEQSGTRQNDMEKTVGAFELAVESIVTACSRANSFEVTYRATRIMKALTTRTKLAEESLVGRSMTPQAAWDLAIDVNSELLGIGRDLSAIRVEEERRVDGAIYSSRQPAVYGGPPGWKVGA